MVPVGLALSAAGYEVNRYGGLLAERVIGSRRPGVLLVLHLVIGIASVVPLAVAAALLPPERTPLIAGGAVYGAAYWFMVNALSLPVVYDQPHPWTGGVAAVWPSLLVHIVFGLAAAIAITAVAGDRVADGPGRHRGANCSPCRC